MSYFEFIINGDLTPIYEEKTELLLSQMNEGYSIYKLEKYYDEKINEEKKARTIILTSSINIINLIYPIFKDCKVQYIGYYKQRII